MKKLGLTLLALFLIAFAVWPSALVKTSTISSSYTLSESVKSLNIIQQKPAATQKYIASEIGQSERTIKGPDNHSLTTF